MSIVSSNTTNSTSGSSGSISTLGGVGITKDLVIGGNVMLTGTSQTLNVGNNLITSLATPISSTDAANKGYVD